MAAGDPRRCRLQASVGIVQSRLLGPGAALGCWVTRCREFRSIHLQRDGHKRLHGDQANRPQDTEQPTLTPGYRKGVLIPLFAG